MHTGDLMRAYAARIDAVKDRLGLQGVDYPARNTFPASPWLMIRQSLVLPSTVEKGRAGVQVVRPRVDLVALVASDPKRPGDAARLDGLVDPLLDLFDANANGGNVNAAFAGLLDDTIERVWHEARVRRAVMEWGEVGYCHAAIITLDSEYRRRAELP